MPQLNIYVSKDLAEEIRRRADKDHLSVSKYLANLVQSRMDNEVMPDSFWATFGSWTGEWPEVKDEVPEPAEPLGI